ncbi:MAG: regulatory protein RecX [Candidatus Eisenbacteria bacterium]
MSGKITAIERAAEGSPLTVYVDGKPVLEVSDEVASRLGLEVGMELAQAGRAGTDDDRDAGRVSGEEAEEALPGGRSHADELAAAREAALRLLSVRARSVRELADRLRRKSFGRRAIEETLDGLGAAGLLDDRAFAKLWADERVRQRPVGPLKLRTELSAKGVPGAIVDEVLRETFQEHDEVELALRALRKRVGIDAVTQKERARLHAFLLRRGFTFDAVAQALRGLEAETDDADPDL